MKVCQRNRPLVSTGGSCIEVVEALRNHGAEVFCIASIFTYGMSRSIERLAEAQVKNVTASSVDVLIEVASNVVYIKPEDKGRILKFRDNPSDEFWIK